MKQENLTQNQALTQLLVAFIAAKQQLVAAAIANHPEPGHLREDLASGNLTSQVVVADQWLRILLLIGGTGVPIEQPLLHFKLPAHESLQ